MRQKMLISFGRFLIIIHFEGCHTSLEVHIYLKHITFTILPEGCTLQIFPHFFHNGKMGSKVTHFSLKICVWSIIPWYIILYFKGIEVTLLNVCLDSRKKDLKKYTVKNKYFLCFLLFLFFFLCFKMKLQASFQIK